MYSGSVLLGRRDAGNTISTTARKASGAPFNTSLTKSRHSFHRIWLLNSFHRFLDSHLVSATFFQCDLGKTASPRSLPFDFSPFGFRYFLEGLGGAIYCPHSMVTLTTNLFDLLLGQLQNSLQERQFFYTAFHCKSFRV